MTLQGKAIHQASIDFGNGQTLPFTPCKKGYLPTIVVHDESTSKKKHSRNITASTSNSSNTCNARTYMVACPLHEQARRKRLAKEDQRIRPGEVDPSQFWHNYEQEEKINSNSPLGVVVEEQENIEVPKKKMKTKSTSAT